MIETPRIGGMTASMGAETVATALAADMTVIPDDVPRIGVLGNLDILHTWRGGLGTVHLCVPRDLRIPVAMKTFSTDLLLNGPYRRAFYRECAVAMKLSELPGFLTVFGVWEYDGTPYLAMRPILPDAEGIVSLRDLLNRGKIAIMKIAFIGWSIADSLARASELVGDLVHGDLKPENVLLSNGIPNITDFGLARAAGAFGTRDKLPTTAAYRSPELDDDIGYFSVASDIYSYGVTIKELLQRQSAIHVADSDSGLNKASRIAQGLEALASRCQQLVPEFRPSSFRDIATTIEALIEGDWQESTPTAEARDRIAAALPALAAMRAEENLGSLLRVNQPQLIVDAVNSVPEDTRTAVQWRYHGLALAAMDYDAAAVGSLRQAAAGFEKGSNYQLSWQTVMDLATSLTHTGQLQEADRHYVRLIETAADKDQLSIATANFAILQIELGRLDAAEKLLQIALRHTPAAAKTCAILAELHIKLNRPQMAVDFLRQAILRDPRPEYHIILGEVLLLRLGRFDEALTVFNTAISMGSLDERLLHHALVSAIQEHSRAVDDILDILSQHFSEGTAGATLREALVHAAALARRFHGPDDGIEQYLQPEDLERIPGLVPAQESGARQGGSVLAAEHYLDGSLRLPGDIRVEEMDGGFLTFDLFLPFDTPQFFEILEVWVRRVRILAGPQISCLLRDGLPILMRCSGCGSDITTNRDSGELFACRNCHQLIRAVATGSELEDRARAAFGKEEDTRSLDDCAALLAMQFSEQVPQEILTRLEDLLRERDFELLPADHPGTMQLLLHGVGSGMFTPALPLTCGRYAFPPGLTGVLSQTPRYIEQVVRGIRIEFRSMRLSSASLPYDTNADDFYSLVLQDRLDEAEAELLIDESGSEAGAGWLMLAEISLVRNHTDSAARQIGMALDLDPTADAWVIAGWIQLRGGDPSAARRSAERALAEAPLSAPAHALLATVLNELGDQEGAQRVAVKARGLLLGERGPAGEDALGAG